MATHHPTQQAVRDWYSGRTDHILERYGGDRPRVHYHTGLVSEIPNTINVDHLKRELRTAQVRLLDLLAKEWHPGGWSSGDVLDSGCGLGGGAIYWAENYNVNITAISLVQSHLDLVRQYATELGLHRRIQTLCIDAHQVHLLSNQLNRYNAVVAIDSSCYMDLPRWFDCLRQILRRPGKLYVADGFVGPHADRLLIDEVDEYFACKMVNISDYIAITGARSVKAIDLSDQAARFFGTTYPLIETQAIMNGNLAEKQRSLNMHSLLKTLFEQRQLQYCALEVDPWS